MEKTKEISGETCRKCGKARNSPEDLYCSKCGNLLNYNPLLEEIEIAVEEGKHLSVAYRMNSRERTFLLFGNGKYKRKFSEFISGFIDQFKYNCPNSLLNEVESVYLVFENIAFPDNYSGRDTHINDKISKAIGDLKGATLYVHPAKYCVCFEREIIESLSPFLEDFFSLGDLYEQKEVLCGINIYLPSPKLQKLVPWLKLREANQDLKLKISNAKYSSCDKCDVLCNLLGL